MNICILNRETSSLNLHASHDGGSLHIAKLVDFLSSKGHFIDIFSEGDFDTTFFSPQVRLIRVGSPPIGKNNIKTERHLNSAYVFAHNVIVHKEFNLQLYDVIHVHHWSSCINPLTNYLKKTPLIFTPHLSAHQKALTDSSYRESLILIEESNLFEISNRIIALSNYEKETIINEGQLKPEKIQIIPNGIDNYLINYSKTSRIYNSVTYETSKKMILSVGRLSLQKNFLPLIKAIHILRINNNINICLVIVGSLKDEFEHVEKIKELVTELKLENIIILTGELPIKEVYEYMHKCDVYVQSSLIETQGIALIEAMSIGCPVVINNIEPISHMIENGRNGIIVNCENYLELSNAIYTVLNNSSYNDYAEKYRKVISDRYSWNRNLQKIEDTLMEVKLERK
ncbi:MAG: glycosyltransferase family 4 protein [Candidatus Delongbacteria bacterium]|nr:glycosyltransferase family 4 protein [Candidatus Delongbacteria bacterium]